MTEIAEANLCQSDRRIAKSGAGADASHYNVSVVVDDLPVKTEVEPDNSLEPPFAQLEAEAEQLDVADLRDAA